MFDTVSKIIFNMDQDDVNPFQVTSQLVNEYYELTAARECPSSSNASVFWNQPDAPFQALGLDMMSDVESVDGDFDEPIPPRSISSPARMFSS